MPWAGKGGVPRGSGHWSRWWWKEVARHMQRTPYNGLFSVICCVTSPCPSLIIPLCTSTASPELCNPLIRQSAFPLRPAPSRPQTLTSSSASRAFLFPTRNQHPQPIPAAATPASALLAWRQSQGSTPPSLQCPQGWSRVAPAPSSTSPKRPGRARVAAVIISLD